MTREAQDWVVHSKPLSSLYAEAQKPVVILQTPQKQRRAMPSLKFRQPDLGPAFILLPLFHPKELLLVHIP